jgi:hypothetical protein
MHDKQVAHQCKEQGTVTYRWQTSTQQSKGQGRCWRGVCVVAVLQVPAVAATGCWVAAVEHPPCSSRCQLVRCINKMQSDSQQLLAGQGSNASNLIK